MRLLRLLGSLVVLFGIALIAISVYITSQVNEGKEKISKGEEMVEKGDQITSLNPYTKEISKPLWDSAQKKIDTGKEEVTQYESLAGRLQIGGIIALVVGVILFFFSRKKR